MHCGDIGDATVISRLSACAPLSVVRGNNDLENIWCADEREILVSIPWELELDLPGGRLGVCHGHQEPSVPKRHAYLRNTFSDCRGVAYGHSHELVIDEDDADCLVVNPGAAGRARTNGGPSCLILDAKPDH